MGPAVFSVAAGLQLKMQVQKYIHVWEVPNAEVKWGKLCSLLPHEVRIHWLRHSCLAREPHHGLHVGSQVVTGLLTGVAWLCHWEVAGRPWTMHSKAHEQVVGIVMLQGMLKGGATPSCLES